MNTARPLLAPVALAALAGFALWFTTSLVTGKKEPWDEQAYWTLAYPAAIAISAALGYAYPQHPVRSALVLFLSQFAAMCVRNGELGNLWPLGMALFAVIAVPAIVAAAVAAKFGRAAREDGRA